MISYRPLWKTMEEKGITTYTLINKHGINARTVQHLKTNRSITVYTMEKLCRILDCQAGDIVEFLPDEEA